MNDFRLEDLDSFDLLSAEKVANKYGGDKRKIGEAAQMGLINPTVAVPSIVNPKFPDCDTLLI